MILFSGTMKVSGAEMMQKSMGAIGLREHSLMVGAIELAALVLYWIPKFSNLGFFLLISYSGGIIVAEMIGGGFPLPGVLVATLLYVGTFLRKPSLSGLGI